MLTENFPIFIILLFFSLFAIVTIFLVQQGKKRIAMGIISSILMIVLVNSTFNITGLPRPAMYEMFIFQKDKYKVLTFYIVKNRGIYMLLLSENDDIPIYVRFPYSDKIAKMLKKAEKEGKKKRKGKIVLKRKKNAKRWEKSLEQFDIKHEIDFPEAPPPKKIENDKPYTVR